jgi:hypothetical protein
MYAKLGQAEPAILRNQVTFHAEQAAEKALKAVLVHAAVEFPKTHDLQALLLLLRNSGISVAQEIEQAATLTRFAVETIRGRSSRSHRKKWRGRSSWPTEPLDGRGSRYTKSQGPGDNSKPCATGRQMRTFQRSASAILPGSFCDWNLWFGPSHRMHRITCQTWREVGSNREEPIEPSTQSPIQNRSL